MKFFKDNIFIGFIVYFFYFRIYDSRLLDLKLEKMLFFSIIFIYGMKKIKYLFE